MKKRIRTFFCIVQRWLLAACLFTVYFLVFGLTVVAAFLFNRRLLKIREKAQGSSWLPAAGYENDPENMKMQS